MLKRIILIITLITTLPILANTTGQPHSKPQTKMMRVGVVMLHDKTPPVDYIATDVWGVIANQLGIQYQLVKLHNISKAFAELKDKKIDILLGPIKDAPNKHDLLFLNSYIRDAIGIVVPRVREGVWYSIWPFIYKVFGLGLLLLIILHLIVGYFIWHVERKHNPKFEDTNIIQGVFYGFWYSWVTMTTVGYGDFVPVTLAGRLISIFWMLIAIIIMASVSVAITAEITTVKVSYRSDFQLKDLKANKVAYIEDNKAALRLIQKYGGRPIAVSSLKQGLNLVSHKKVVAGFFDRIKSRYAIKHDPDLPVYITDYMFDFGRFAFVVRRDNPYALDINSTLFTMMETGALKRIEIKWLGSADLPYLESNIK